MARTKLSERAVRALMIELTSVISMASAGVTVPNVRDAVHELVVRHGAPSYRARRLVVRVRPRSRCYLDGRKVTVGGLHDVFDAPRNSGLPTVTSVSTFHGRG